MSDDVTLAEDGGDPAAPVPSTQVAIFANHFYLHHDEEQGVWRIVLAEAGPAGAYGRGTYALPDAVMNALVRAHSMVTEKEALGAAKRAAAKKGMN